MGECGMVRAWRARRTPGPSARDPAHSAAVSAVSGRHAPKIAPAIPYFCHLTWPSPLLPPTTAVLQDFAPSGKNMCKNTTLEGSEQATWTTNGAGRVLKKARFIEYSDAEMKVRRGRAHGGAACTPHPRAPCWVSLPICPLYSLNSLQNHCASPTRTPLPPPPPDPRGAPR